MSNVKLPTFGLGRQTFKIGVGIYRGYHIMIRGDSWADAYDYLVSPHFMADLKAWDRRLAEKLKGHVFELIEE